MNHPITFTNSAFTVAKDPPHTYRGSWCLGITLLVIAILTGCGVTGHLQCTALSRSHLIVVITVPSLLALGCSFIFHRAITKGHARGITTNKWAVIRFNKNDPMRQIDLSQLDSEGKGIVYGYCKKLWACRLTGLGLALFTPIYIVAVMVYNVFRLVIIPFYIIFRMIQEKYDGMSSYPNERFFSSKDILFQMALSMKRIIQAPFYGTALGMTGMMAIVDPLNGIKLGSAIEYDWNERVPLRDKGIWMLNVTKGRNWRWEGGGGPIKLSENGFYVAGSWQPYWKLEIDHFTIIKQKMMDDTKFEVEKFNFS